MKYFIESKTTVIESIGCDFCTRKWKKFEFPGAIDVSFVFSYPSEFDGIEFKFDLCDECFRRHFAVIGKLSKFINDVDLEKL